MKKIKLVLRVTRKVARKAVTGGLKSGYKGKSLPKLAVKTVHYGIKFGPKALATKLKQEIVSIDRRLGNNLAFPNGLVTGVDMSSIKDWYAARAKPVTIVIPSYNDFELLQPLIASIKETTVAKYAKVIIVDDFCEAGNRKQLEGLQDEQVSIIFRDKNGGFAKAVNTGLRAADKKHDVVLLNSDMIAHDNWLEALQYGAYEFGVDTGIVGPKLLYPDGRIQSAGSHRNTEVPEFFDHYYRFQDSNYGPANIPHYCQAVTGACMYVKREFLNYVGILDDNFQFAFEDVDWCLRGWEAGYRSLYFPASVLTHVESASRPKHKTLGPREKQSIKYFWDKWGDWFDKRNVRDEQGRIKIIFVLQSMGMSGGIKIVFEHARRLADRGYSIEVWGLDSHNLPWAVPDNLKIRTFKSYERLTTSLSSEEAIKVATWWETAFPVWLASVTKGIPVYFIQEFESWFYPNDVVAQATVVSCYRKEFRNMTTSQYNLDEIRSIGLTATPIPCGYDNKVYKPLGLKREKNQLLAVGRTFFQKNFRFTFNAWKTLGSERPDMLLFGIEPEIAKWDERITYLTKPDDDKVNELYNTTTIFVQTSRHEGFSLPPLEAMATGCPVICTDSHGNRDFCVDSRNCLMIEHDDVEALARAMKRLMKDKRLRETMGKEGMKTAKRYQWNRIMDEVEQFYEEVAK